MNIVSQPIELTGAAGAENTGLRLDDRATQCYLGAAVIGGAVIVTAVGATTIAAPAVTLVPIAGAAALAITGQHIRDNARIDAEYPVTESTAA